MPLGQNSTGKVATRTKRHKRVNMEWRTKALLADNFSVLMLNFIMLLCLIIRLNFSNF